MGISRYTALVIQGNGEDIKCQAESIDGKWSGTIYHYKNGYPHSLLLSTEYVYESEEKAIASMEQVVKEIRQICL